MKQKNSSLFYFLAFGFVLFGFFYFAVQIYAHTKFGKNLNKKLAKSGVSLSVSKPYQELLKKQAKEREEVLETKSKVIKDLKEEQKIVKNNLLKKHRIEREEFLKRKTTPEERKEFFLKQRSDMFNLKKEQDNQLKLVQSQWNEKLKELKNKHKKEREEFFTNSESLDEH